MKAKYSVDKIKEAIEILGGRYRLAVAIGVSHKSVSDWVLGYTTPSTQNCLKIQKATNGKVKAKEILLDINWDEFE